jgi:hypothetical protein
MGAIRAVRESGGILSKVSVSWLEYFVKTAHGSRAILEGVESVQQILSSANVGEKVPATVLRGGAPTQFSITLDDRPAR